MGDHPSWLSVNSMVRVEPQGLDEFAQRVQGELLSAFGDSRSRSEPMLQESLMVPFGGGGLVEGEAFGQAHMLYALAMSDFLNDVANGLLNLGMGAANICLEYQATDAQEAISLESVQRMFQPAEQARHHAAERAEDWAMQTYDTFRGEGVVDGWAASMAAEHAPSDVVDGWAARMTAEHADPAQQPAADRIEPTFEERVQERVDQFEPQGTDTAGSGGMGDLGEGRRAHEVLGGPDPDHPEVLHTTPGDTEHVADIPPESMEAAIDAGQRDA